MIGKLFGKLYSNIQEIKSYFEKKQEQKRKRSEEKRKRKCIQSLTALHKLSKVYEIEASTGKRVKLLEKLAPGIYGFCDDGKDLRVCSYVSPYNTLGNVIEDVKKYHLGIETHIENVKQMLEQKGINYRKDLLSTSSKYVVVPTSGWMIADYTVHEKIIGKLDKVLFVVEELLGGETK
jgi:hypothetical protein